MTILDRYLTKEILKSFAIVLIVVLGLYIIVEFFNKADNFMEAGLSIFRLIRYLQLKLPQIIVEIAPIGILLAVLVALGLMNKHNETIALKSGGVSVYFLMRAVLAIAVVRVWSFFSYLKSSCPSPSAKPTKFGSVKLKKDRHRRHARKISGLKAIVPYTLLSTSTRRTKASPALR